jgi:hypothetical protein
MAQERGVQRGMTFLDGPNICAHRPAAGAAKKGAAELDVLRVKRLVDLVAALLRLERIRAQVDWVPIEALLLRSSAATGRPCWRTKPTSSWQGETLW